MEISLLENRFEPSEASKPRTNSVHVISTLVLKLKKQLPCHTIKWRNAGEHIKTWKSVYVPLQWHGLGEIESVLSLLSERFASVYRVHMQAHEVTKVHNIDLNFYTRLLLFRKLFSLYVFGKLSEPTVIFLIYIMHYK